MAVPTPSELAAAQAVVAAALPVAVTVPVAVPAVATLTLGQSIDVRVAALEAAAKTDWADVSAWFKANWAHFLTYVGIGVVLLKLFGRI